MKISTTKKILLLRTIYINFGWVEDNILNKEFGFSNTEENLKNTTNDGAANDESSLFSKFNSRSSYIIYDENLHGWMRNMET